MVFRIRNFVAFALLFVLCGSSALSQPGVFNTEYQFLNEQSTVISHTRTWDKGSVLLCESFDSANHTLTLLKVDSVGNHIWDYSWNSNNVSCSKIGNTCDSGVCVAYTEYYNQNGSNSYHLLRLDRDGNEIYSRLYSFPTRYETIPSPPGILPRNNGGCYLLATVKDSIGNKSRWNLLSIDTAGNVVWSKCFDTTGVHLNTNCLDTCLNGDILLAGTGIEQPSGNHVVVITRVAVNGNFQWSKHYQSNYYDIDVMSLTNLSNDNFYVTSSTHIPFTTYPEVSVLQITGGGAIMWSNRYGSSGISLDTREGQTVESDRMIFLTYGMDSSQQFSSCYGRVSATGVLEEARRYKFFEGNSIDTCGGRFYSIAGAAGQYYSSARYMSVDSIGNSCMDTLINMHVAALPLSVTPGTGSMPFNVASANDSLVHPATNIVASVACGPNAISEAETFDFRMYPVPASEYIVIESENKLSGIEIYNASGMLVYASQNPQSTARIDISGFPAGIYLLRASEVSQVAGKLFIIE